MRRVADCRICNKALFVDTALYRNVTDGNGPFAAVERVPFCVDCDPIKDRVAEMRTKQETIRMRTSV